MIHALDTRGGGGGGGNKVVVASREGGGGGGGGGTGSPKPHPFPGIIENSVFGDLVWICHAAFHSGDSCSEEFLINDMC